jgi:hypothetical protein
MEVRRATYGAAIKLALVLSTVAAVIALTLDAMGDVSTSGLVITVAMVGFVTSWVQTGRVTRAVATHRGHRITVMPLRDPVA